jgi:hypothetical protein
MFYSFEIVEFNFQESHFTKISIFLKLKKKKKIWNPFYCQKFFPKVWLALILGMILLNFYKEIRYTGTMPLSITTFSITTNKSRHSV